MKYTKMAIMMAAMFTFCLYTPATVIAQDTCPPDCIVNGGGWTDGGLNDWQNNDFAYDLGGGSLVSNFDMGNQHWGRGESQGGGYTGRFDGDSAQFQGRVTEQETADGLMQHSISGYQEATTGAGVDEVCPEMNYNAQSLLNGNVNTSQTPDGMAANLGLHTNTDVSGQGVDPQNYMAGTGNIQYYSEMGDPEGVYHSWQGGEGIISYHEGEQPPPPPELE